MITAKISSEQEVTIGMNEMLMTCGAAGALNVVLKSILDPDIWIVMEDCLSHRICVEVCVK